MQHQIRSFVSLRAIFALLIFLHHSPLNDKTHIFEFAGSLGVTFFFILSGFVLSAGYADSVQMKDFSYLKYIKKRLVKIYPLHILLLLYYIVVNIYRGVWCPSLCLKAIVNGLLMQSYIPIKDVYFSFNAASWFLSDIMLCYICFPFISRLISENIKKSTFSVGALTVIFLVLNILLPEKYCQDVLYINPVCRIPDFILGVFLYRICSEYIADGIPSKNAKCIFIETAALTLLIITILLSNQCSSKMQLAVIWWIPLSLIIAVFHTFEKNGAAYITKALQCRVLQWVGKLSFTIYMIHIPVIQFSSFALRRLHMPVAENSIALQTVIPLIITISASYLIHRYFESLFVK